MVHILNCLTAVILLVYSCRDTFAADCITADCNVADETSLLQVKQVVEHSSNQPNWAQFFAEGQKSQEEWVKRSRARADSQERTMADLDAAKQKEMLDEMEQTKDEAIEAAEKDLAETMKAIGGQEEKEEEEVKEEEVKEGAETAAVAEVKEEVGVEAAEGRDEAIDKSEEGPETAAEGTEAAAEVKEEVAVEAAEGRDEAAEKSEEGPGSSDFVKDVADKEKNEVTEDASNDAKVVEKQITKANDEASVENVASGVAATVKAQAKEVVEATLNEGENVVEKNPDEVKPQDEPAEVAKINAEAATDGEAGKASEKMEDQVAEVLTEEAVVEGNDGENDSAVIEEKETVDEKKLVQDAALAIEEKLGEDLASTAPGSEAHKAAEAVEKKVEENVAASIEQSS